MNLLFLTPQLPHPPRQGTAIRNWGLIKSLAARHTITLLTFAVAAEAITTELRAACAAVEVVPPPPPRAISDRLQTLLTSPLPDLAQRLHSPAFAARLAHLLQNNSFGTIFVEGLELARYCFTPENIKNNPASPTIKIIFDAHNCETLLQRRAFQTDVHQPSRWPQALYSFIQVGRLARFEAEVCRHAAQVTCVSAEDAAALGSIALGLAPVVVPNGIFLSDYALPSLSPKPLTPTLVFSGKMDYRPNVDAAVWFAHDILPLIRREKPEAQFLIMGQKPVEAVRQLATLPSVVVTGEVPDARPYIAGAAVYIAPLRMGGGTRFKLLEALALQRPIVSTTVGAEGFDLQNGREILLADSPAAFAQAVVSILNSPTRGEALSTAGYSFVQAYDWANIVPKLEALLS